MGNKVVLAMILLLTLSPLADKQGLLVLKVQNMITNMIEQSFCSGEHVNALDVAVHLPEARERGLHRFIFSSRHFFSLFQLCPVEQY
jgi:hypothetical protein